MGNDCHFGQDTNLGREADFEPEIQIFRACILETVEDLVAVVPGDAEFEPIVEHAEPQECFGGTNG